MFSLPQPSTEARSRIQVNIPEEAEIMRTILTFIYPRYFKQSPLTDATVAHLARLLRIAVKYDVEVSVEKISEELARFARKQDHRRDSDPKTLQIYAVGCVLGVESLVREAKIACMSYSYSHLTDENSLFESKITSSEKHPVKVEEAQELRGLLREFSALDLQRLLKFHLDWVNKIKQRIPDLPRKGCSYCGTNTDEHLKSRIDDCGPGNLQYYLKNGSHTSPSPLCETCCDEYWLNIVESEEKPYYSALGDLLEGIRDERVAMA
jgi:hypothetical protein